jgi:capsule polysaccharide export protein KpsE/RkpR
MYLESLKTYEIFAASDSLFAKAAQRFHLLAEDSQSTQALKRRVLKVSKLRDTKVLQISVTLPDPKLAQSLAQYLAEETANLSRQESLEADQGSVEQAQRQAAGAQRHLEELQKSWSDLAVNGHVESLQSEIDSDVDLRSQVEQKLVEAQTELVEYQQQQSGGQFAREQAQAAQARVALLERRSQELQRSIQEKTRTLAGRTAKQEALQTALKVAQDSYRTISARLQESQASVGSHAEQLRVIDPGIVPERPSSPDTSLNIAVALLVALISSIVYLSVAFVYGRRTIHYEPTLPRGMRG